MKQNGLKRKSGHDLIKQRMNNRLTINLPEWRKTSLDIYRRQLTNRIFKRMKISSILYISITASLISISPLSAESVPKIGNTCPQGYHLDGSSGYCVSSRDNARQVVPKIGNTCPSGYHTDGSSGYCSPSSSNKEKDLIPKRGNTCPSGYHTDGTSGYCKQN